LLDLRLAFRHLRRSPAFFLFAALTLALGIGANLAIFSVVSAVLLKPLPYQDASRIVAITNLWKNTGRIGSTVSAPDFDDLRAQNDVFAAMAVYSGGEIGVQLPGGAEFAPAFRVSEDFFRVFQVQPIAGHLFDGPDSVLVSEGFWKRHFGADPSAIGRTLKVMDRSFTISGVLPESFHFPAKAEIWTPIGAYRTRSPHRSGHNFLAVARLKPDVTTEQARTQLTAIAARLESQYPQSNKDKSVAVIALKDRTVSRIRETLWLLMGAVGLILLIACANVSSLMLARAAGRAREIAVRAAIGASRARLIRQLFIESALLALLGAAGGLALATSTTRLILNLAPANVPRLAEVQMDGWVLAFLLIASSLAVLLSGLAPALHASRVDLIEALKQNSARGPLGGSNLNLRRILTTGEVAISCALLIAAILLTRSLLQLNRAELGFQPSQLLVMYTAVPAQDLADHQRAYDFFRGALAELRTLPGVHSVAATMGLPYGKYGSDGGYVIKGRPTAANLSEMPQAGFRLATPGFFSALGVPLRAGRDFEENDRYDVPFVAIVNQALVRQSFPNENPIGHQLTVGLDSPNPMTIVGVVADVRHEDPSKPPGPEIYMPYQQHPFYANEMQVVLRGSIDAASVRQVIRRLNPEVAVQFTSMETLVSEANAAPRFRTALIALFAILAVTLAAAGVYAVVAHRVAERTAEIGLRMSLGAGGPDVLRLVLRDTAAIAVPGLGIGLLLAFAASRILATLLYEVKPADPISFLAAALALTVVAASAALFPALRALRVDPVTALRSE
jgi:putative ABC transport system permease protein